MSKATPEDAANVVDRLNATLADELADLDFRCAICGKTFGQHDIRLLKTCFQSFTQVLADREAAVREDERRRCAEVAKKHNENHQDEYSNCGLAIAEEIENGA